MLKLVYVWLAGRGGAGGCVSRCGSSFIVDCDVCVVWFHVLDLAEPQATEVVLGVYWM